MNIALYARVSKPQRGQLTEVQAKEQNPEVQLRELRAWCEVNKHKVVAEYVERLSGKNTQRPQLQRLMRDVSKGLRDIDAVLVWRLDRFGRSGQDLHNLVGELQKQKVAFISLKEGFDLTTTTGKAMFGMLAVFAEFERNVIAERTKAGLALARAEGRLPGRKIDPTKGPSRTTRWRQQQRQLAS
jgi:DNA invertase Pin-like site-specific DNA recombinase